MKKITFIIILALVSFLSSAQEVINFRGISLVAPPDFVVQANCSVFFGTNEEISISIGSQDYRNSADSVVAVITAVAQKYGYRKTPADARKFEIEDAKGYSIGLVKDKMKAVFIGLIINDDRQQQVLIEITYGDKNREQVQRIINSISIDKTGY